VLLIGTKKSKRRREIRQYSNNKTFLNVLSTIYNFPCFYDEAKRVAVVLFFKILFMVAYPKNPHLDQKKSKKNRPSDGTDTVRRQVKKKHKNGHNNTIEEDN
jgi:hypothetical protein